MNQHPLLIAIDYINNGGSQFVSVKRFDDDFEPVGKQLRDELLKQKVISITGETIRLADKYCRRSFL